ncbi:MAG: hypothetical protein C0408_08320, partial [Odoribacter sp.]|nr:hypothetical protein [Odoribacter sp.]
MHTSVQKAIALFFCSGISGWLCAQNNATPAEIRLKAWENHQRLKVESPFRDLKWRSVGPEFCGGRIEAIACHPDEPYTFYVGAGS